MRFDTVFDTVFQSKQQKTKYCCHADNFVSCCFHKDKQNNTQHQKSNYVPTVNQRVIGSSPICGAQYKPFVSIDLQAAFAL
jgi:hypothetical protein